jgi:hypothetical protein
MPEKKTVTKKPKKETVDDAPDTPVTSSKRAGGIVITQHGSIYTGTAKNGDICARGSSEADVRAKLEKAMK